MSKSNPKKRDASPLLITVIAIVAILFAVFAIAMPIMKKIEFDKFQQDFTESINEAHREGSIMVSKVTDEESGFVKQYALGDSASSWLYYMMMDIGMGTPLKEGPEDCRLKLDFPNGSVMKIDEVPVVSGVKKGKPGLYVYFKNKEGKEYRFVRDALNSDVFMEVL